MIGVNKKTAENHGLTEEEYEKNYQNYKVKTEFHRTWYFSAMWNEHCSYKSSKK